MFLDKTKDGFVHIARAFNISNGDLPLVVSPLAPTQKTYQFLPEARELFLTSSNNADTQLIYISGLDADKKLKTFSINLQGTTPVSTGLWLRGNVIRNINHVNTLGQVYLCDATTYTTPGVPDDLNKVVQTFTPSAQSSQISVLSTPIDFYAGWLAGFEVSLLRGSSDVFGNFTFKGNLIGSELREVAPLAVKNQCARELIKWIKLRPGSDMQVEIDFLTAPNVNVSFVLYVYFQNKVGS